MRINRTYNPRTREITDNLPKWSAGYSDPNSNINKLVNPIINVMDYFEDEIDTIAEDAKLITTDPDRFPYHRWLIDFRDVISFNEDEFTTANDYIGSIEDIYASISGEIVTMGIVDNVHDFYEPELQSAWYVSGMVEHAISGTISSCEMLSTGLAIVSPSGYLEGNEVSGWYDPGMILTYQLPNRWTPNTDQDEDLVLIGSESDPLFTTYSETFTITKPDQRVLLTRQLANQTGKLTVVNVSESTEESAELVITSGFTLYDTSSYTVRDVYIGDVDNDGIIDSRELDLMVTQIGKKRSDFTIDEWNDTYSRYDINGDETIDSLDMSIVEALQDTIQSDVSAISFDQIGVYRVEYTAGIDGEGGVTSVMAIGDGVGYINNESFGYLKQLWPPGTTDGCYDTHKSIWYVLDNNIKCIWAYQSHSQLDVIYDKMKILLPIRQGMDLRGITYSNFRIYILVKIGTTFYVLIMRTDHDNPEDYVTWTAIHSGQRSSLDTDIVLRDNISLTNDTRGLTMINDSKLATIDEGYIKILLPIYDYMYASSDDVGTNVVSFRSNYEELSVDIGGEVSGVYLGLWNTMDFHAEKKGLRRIPGEDNYSLRTRSLDVYQHLPTRDKQGALYGIQRELGLPTEEIYDPTLEILPESINHENGDTMLVIENDEVVPYDNMDVKHNYQYGKYSHDTITYTYSGETVLAVDKDIIL